MHGDPEHAGRTLPCSATGARNLCLVMRRCRTSARRSGAWRTCWGTRGFRPPNKTRICRSTSWSRRHAGRSGLIMRRGVGPGGRSWMRCWSSYGHGTRWWWGGWTGLDDFNGQGQQALAQPGAPRRCRRRAGPSPRSAPGPFGPARQGTRSWPHRSTNPHRHWPPAGWRRHRPRIRHSCYRR